VLKRDVKLQLTVTADYSPAGDAGVLNITAAA